MTGTLSILLINALLAPAMLYLGIWTGYWMARNAADRPLRSPHNPPRARKRRKPIEEPEGDPFVEAMTAPPTEEGRVPTLPNDRR